MAVMGLVLERRAAPRTIAGRGREAAAAFRTEGGIGFGARTVGGTRGSREREAGSRSRVDGTAPGSRLPALRAQRDQCFGGVFAFQRVVIGVRELPRGAIELDLFQGAERDGAG